MHACTHGHTRMYTCIGTTSASHALNMSPRVSIHARMHAYTRCHAIRNVCICVYNIHERTNSYTHTDATRSEQVRVYTRTHTNPRHTHWSFVRVCTKTHACTHTPIAFAHACSSTCTHTSQTLDTCTTIPTHVGAHMYGDIHTHTPHVMFNKANV